MTDKPRLLDLFCCAGGASVGYARAGFDVVGVDIDPQPNYPFELSVFTITTCPAPVQASVRPQTSRAHIASTPLSRYEP